MRKYLAAVALAAAIAQPAAAVTFPSLTTTYVGAGVMDGTGTALQVATAFTCSNVSGLIANLRILILKYLAETSGGSRGLARRVFLLH